MSGTNISVAPGNVPTQLSGAPFRNGATVYNNNSTISVWISDTPSTSITNGYQIGPLGSVRWKSERAPWAIVGSDTHGAPGTTPVLLTVSDNIDEPVNPINNALAIAQAGIPSLSTTTAVWRQPGGSPIVVLPGTGTPLIAVDSYSSLLFTVSVGLANASFGLVLEHYDTPQFDHVIAIQNFGSTSLGPFAYRTPLYGGGVGLFNSSHSAGQVTVSGSLSTRTVTKGSYVTSLLSTATPLNSIIRGAGPGFVPDNISPKPFGGAFFSNGGIMSFRLFLSSGAAAGTAYYLGLQQLLYQGTGPSDLVSATNLWGPFNSPGPGSFQTFLPNVSIPAGTYRATIYTTDPNTLLIDLQISFSEGTM